MCDPIRIVYTIPWARKAKDKVCFLRKHFLHLIDADEQSPLPPQDCLHDPLGSKVKNKAFQFPAEIAAFLHLSVSKNTDSSHSQNDKSLFACAKRLCLSGDPARIRTLDLLIRSELLYPAELRNLEFGCKYRVYYLIWKQEMSNIIALFSKPISFALFDEGCSPFFKVYSLC